MFLFEISIRNTILDNSIYYFDTRKFNLLYKLESDTYDVFDVLHSFYILLIFFFKYKKYIPKSI